MTIYKTGVTMIETKVKAATFWSGAAVTVLLAVLSGASEQNLVASLPDWLVAPAGMLLTTAITFLAGWKAQHTQRPDL